LLGIALREVREDMGWARRVIAGMVHVSESLVNEWEHGRRTISDSLKQVLARKLNSGKLCMSLKHEATGGVMAAPYLDGENMDNHRLVCIDRTIEEMEEAVAALRLLQPIFRLPPGRVAEDQRQLIASRMMEVIEADTAAENMLARVARDYGLSLPELYDQHQAELIEKGYLEKEKSPQKRAAV